jgi:hypothetical protein
MIGRDLLKLERTRIGLERRVSVERSYFSVTEGVVLV